MSDDMWTGPVVDDRPTFFTQGKHVPSGWEWRNNKTTLWYPAASLTVYMRSTWVQTRESQLSDPGFLWRGDSDEGDCIEYVVRWDHIRDRTDLDRWERMTPGGTWWPFNLKSKSQYAEDFTLRIRRKKSVDQ